MSDNPDDGTDESIENYSGDTESFTVESERTDPIVRRYRRGKHTLPESTSEERLRAAAMSVDDEERAERLREAADEYEEMTKEPAEFECPVCGLGHSHGSRKHDIRMAFDVREAFAESMQYQPNCHCGVNELAVYVEHPLSGVRMFEDRPNHAVDQQLVERVRSAADSAPIGAETRQHIEDIRSTLADGTTPLDGFETDSNEYAEMDDTTMSSPAPSEDPTSLSQAVAAAIEANPSLVKQYEDGTYQAQAVERLGDAAQARLKEPATYSAVRTEIRQQLSDDT